MRPPRWKDIKAEEAVQVLGGLGLVKVYDKRAALAKRTGFEMADTIDPEIERKTRALLDGSPFSDWPCGMPASIDPELVFIGVSPGNSPMAEQPEPGESDQRRPQFVSSPTIKKPSNSHFYYPDTSRYWQKLRYLAHQYFLNENKEISEHSAISRCSHFNLGIGDAGSATKHDVEEAVVKWVSRLLNTIHKPKLVILFGLKGILNDKEVASWWNHTQGLKVNWSSPDNEQTYVGYQQKNYKFLDWYAKADNGNEVKLTMWPNHPSRPPFNDIGIWKRAVSEYM